MYEGIKFQDVYLDISIGRKVGFIACPAAEGKYLGVIFLRGASGSAIVRENPAPILILHGKKDDQCPVEWAYSMERIYKAAGVPCQIKVFPDEGHVFSLKAMDEVRGIVGEFLHKYLGKNDKKSTDSVF